MRVVSWACANRCSCFELALDADPLTEKKLMGNKIASSDYKLEMKKNVNCAILCERKLSQVSAAGWSSWLGYRMAWPGGPPSALRWGMGSSIAC